jgi:hypothetical protein
MTSYMYGGHRDTYQVRLALPYISYRLIIITIIYRIRIFHIPQSCPIWGMKRGLAHIPLEESIVL